MYMTDTDCQEQQAYYYADQEFHLVRKYALEKLERYGITSEEKVEHFLDDYYEGEQEAKIIMIECDLYALERAALRNNMQWFIQELKKKAEEEKGEEAYDDYINRY
jgi:hypothetical protein